MTFLLSAMKQAMGGTIKTPIEVNGTLEQRLEALQSQNRTPLVEIEERLVRSPLHRKDG